MCIHIYIYIYIYIYVDNRGVMDFNIGNRHGGSNSTLDGAVYISHSASNLCKVMNLTILPPASEMLTSKRTNVLFRHSSKIIHLK